MAVKDCYTSSSTVCTEVFEGTGSSYRYVCNVVTHDPCSGVLVSLLWSERQLGILLTLSCSSPVSTLTWQHKTHGDVFSDAMAHLSR